MTRLDAARAFSKPARANRRATAIAIGCVLSPISSKGSNQITRGTSNGREQENRALQWERRRTRQAPPGNESNAAQAKEAQGSACESRELWPPAPIQKTPHAKASNPQTGKRLAGMLGLSSMNTKLRSGARDDI